jgi:hypothetical protein
MANPVHPKVIGGLAGTVAGSGLGSAIYGVLERVPSFAHLDATTKLYIAGIIVAVLSGAGQFIVAYLSRWEPKVAATAGSVIHVLDPNETQAQVAAAVHEEWVKMQAEAGKVLAYHPLQIDIPDVAVTEPTPTPASTVTVTAGPAPIPQPADPEPMPATVVPPEPAPASEPVPDIIPWDESDIPDTTPVD